MWCRCKKGSTREPFVEIWDKEKKEWVEWKEV